MGTKSDPGNVDCYGKALPDEPMFIFLGRDDSAPNMLRIWAKCRDQEIMEGKRPRGDYELTAEARRVADDMVRWRVANDGKWRK